MNTFINGNAKLRLVEPPRTHLALADREGRPTVRSRLSRVLAFAMLAIGSPESHWTVGLILGDSVDGWGRVDPAEAVILVAFGCLLGLLAASAILASVQLLTMGDGGRA